MMQLGEYNTLTILRETDPGLYLGDDSEEVVLLPHKHKPESYQIGDKLRVFVYKDNLQRIIATTLEAKITVGEFGYLRCSEVTDKGAFMEWGIEKDLFVPFKEQARPMKEGNWYIVYAYIDELTERLVGSSKTQRFLDNTTLDIKKYDKVDLLVTHLTERGANVIINGKYNGLIYIENIFEDIRTGDSLPGYVKKIRHDNKVDIILQEEGYRSIEPNSQYVLDELKGAGGFLELSDKSDPDLIKDMLGMSKKSFKKAIGNLYKNKLISIAPDGISLIDKKD